ncbi:MAG: GNAT family N-acetyltransferase [Candidatus Saccharibacteria bacterium]|nr:GNAT family N-acetyltransferase [Rhodoferax sp.]
MAHVTSENALNVVFQKHLPPPPIHLILLGADIARNAAVLGALGYQVNSASFETPQVFAPLHSGKRPGTYQVNLALPGDMVASCGAAVVTDFSPELHPLALFDQLALWLADGATVVLAERKPTLTEPRVKQWLRYVDAIGARCGFIREEFVPSVMDDGDVFVHKFRKKNPPRWQLRHMRPGDFAEIAVLFQEVFGHPLSRELWEWKYANGRGNAVLASRRGTLVAHYGGMYREILLRGKPDWAYGGSDVMVHPNERGVMTKQGPFLLTAATTAEIYGPVAYGFPTERAMLVAERMGLYSKAGRMAEVRWQPSAPRPRLRTRVRALVQGNATDQALADGVWRAMAHDLRDGVVGVRDWKYLEQRYFAHPHNQYEVLAVVSRFTGKAMGVMVMRRLEGSCELLDVIAPLAKLALVIDQARRLTKRWALPYLYCWITTNYASVLVACGGKDQELNVFIPTSCWTDDPRVDMVKGRWWLTSGDTDFR